MLDHVDKLQRLCATGLWERCYPEDILRLKCLDNTFFKWKPYRIYIVCTTCDSIKKADLRDLSAAQCRLCTRRDFSRKDVEDAARARGGKLISKRLSNKAEFECSKGHRWHGIVSTFIRDGYWCLTCANKIPITIDDVSQYVAQYSARVLDTKYVNNHTPMQFECAEGHVWTTTFKSISIGGSWCKKCSSRVNWCEERSRSVFEQLFDAKFPSTRAVLPSKLELDGYNDDLKLAFEYQGVQHYKDHFFHKKKDTFKKRLEYDAKKRAECIELGFNCSPNRLIFWRS